MSKIAIFPGSFDPITRGHVDIVNKGLLIFDKIIISIGINAKKTSLFSLEQRMDWIKETFKDNAKVDVQSYQGLTIDFCKQVDAQFILRGLRSPGDFEYEQNIAYANKEMVPDIETVFLLSGLSYSNISSTIVRDIIIHKGNFQKFVPEGLNITI